MTHRLRGYKVWHLGGVIAATTYQRWLLVPATGILGVVVFWQEPDGTLTRQVWDGADWYWYDGQQFGAVPSTAWGRDEPRPEYLPTTKVACRSCIKQYGVVPDERWAVVAREIQEARWP